MDTEKQKGVNDLADMLERPYTALKKKRVGRPVKHGLYSKFAFQPLTEQWRTKVIEALEEQGLFMKLGDSFLIDMLARLLAQQEIMGRHLSEHGLFMDDAPGSDKGRISPLVQELRHSIRTASMICTQLGLSPTARARLRVPQERDLATRIAQARRD